MEYCYSHSKNKQFLPKIPLAVNPRTQPPFYSERAVSERMFQITCFITRELKTCHSSVKNILVEYLNHNTSTNAHVNINYLFCWPAIDTDQLKNK